MQRRCTRILMLAWAVFWYGLFLPGHQRGLVLLPDVRQDPQPGAQVAPPALDDDCMCRPAHIKPAACTSHDPRNPQPAKRTASCAICDQMQLLESPVTIDLTLPQVGVLAILPIPPLTSLQGVSFIPIQQERGPPASLLFA